MSQFTLPLFFTLFALAIVWLVFVNVLFVRLAKNHPSMYSEIGSPRGFERKATPSLFRFLLSRRPESLGDASILRQANVMRVMLSAHVIGGVLLAYLIASGQYVA